MLTEPTPAPTAHEALVLRLLREHGPLTRGELGPLSGLSRTTLYDAVGALMDNGTLLASVPEVARRRRGRPAEVLTLNPGAGRLLGIEFARRAVRVAATDATQAIFGTTGEPHGPDTPWQTRIDLAWRLADRLTGGTLRPGALNGIGIGVIGPVGPSGHGPLWSPRHDVVVARVRERFGAPALIDDNTRLATLAETVWGAAAGERNVLYLRLSHGVGGGLVMAGALHRGADGRSGMFGHISVDPDGAPCECGAVGCLETVASVEAVLDACRTAGCAVADVPELVTALESGDEMAHAVLSQVGAQVGRVLADVSHAVGPDVIVIGGELVDAGRALMAPIERVLDTRIARGSYGVPRVVPAGLGDPGTALGAIALLRRHTEGETPGLRGTARALMP
ncbi:ROK family transcriptional regulator [Streptomyces sp. 1222.5]|uniref:ROK family transcriptional regulator n=1 Tax=Streptomyces sp. 1222.5 TaxID=1881026 RepID=UPI003D749E6E